MCHSCSVLFQMGRTKDDIWTYYDLATDNNDPARKKATASCRHCPFELKHAQATRLTEHLLFDCKQCPDLVRKSVKLSHPNFKSTKPTAMKRKIDDLEEDDDLDVHLLSPPSNKGEFYVRSLVLFCI